MKKIILVILSLMVICSCAIEQHDFMDLKNYSYKATIKAIFYGNKTQRMYGLEHEFSDKENFIIMVAYPEFLKGETLTMSRGKWNIKHSQINLDQSNLRKLEDESLFCLGIIDTNELKSKKIEKDELEVDGKKLISLNKHVYINQDFCDIQLFIDKLRQVPVRMYINDSKGNKKVEFEYLKFDYFENLQKKSNTY
jgi:hypothetical protein